MLLLTYPKCTTCRRAKSFLDDAGIAVRERDIKAENPTYEELCDWVEKSGLPVKKFFNTSGLLYRSLGLAERLPALSDEERLRLLATDGMLVKRPLLIDGERVLVGFREKEWESLKS